MSASAKRIAGAIATGVRRLGILTGLIIFLFGAFYYATHKPPDRDAGLVFVVFGACVLLPPLKAEARAWRRRRAVGRHRKLTPSRHES